MDREEKILKFREAYKRLDPQDQEAELLRLVKPSSVHYDIIFDDWETGKKYKFKSMKDLVSYFRKFKRIDPNRSYLYKVLKGEYASAYGFQIYYDE